MCTPRTQWLVKYFPAILPMFAVNAIAADIPLYSVHQVSLTSSNQYSNPYTDVQLTGTFQGPNIVITVPGFWDGNSTWMLRMTPTEPGTWTLVDVSSNDSQLNNQGEQVSFDARTATALEIENNMVLKHGFVRVSTVHPHKFEYQDGTPFFLLGDTQWERAFSSTDGLTMENSLFQEYQYENLNSRVKMGFNVATMAWIGTGTFVGNEGGPPFLDKAVARQINPAFFKIVDERVRYLNSKGMVPMITLGGEGQFNNDVEGIRFLTKYLVARYSAYDVIWNGFKEYQEFYADQDIDAYGDTIEQWDFYNHPTTTHSLDNSGQGTSALNNRTWLDFHSFQDRNIASNVYGLGKPVVITEAWYEGSGASVWGPYSEGSWFSGGAQGFYVALMSGVHQAGYEYWAAPRGNTDEILSNMSTPSLRYQKYISDFLANRANWMELEPHDELRVSGGSAMMASETKSSGTPNGAEYIVYTENGGTIIVDLVSASSSLNYEWFDPKTGNIVNTGTTEGGGDRSFTAPTLAPWILRIFSDPGELDPKPNPPENLMAP